MSGAVKKCGKKMMSLFGKVAPRINTELLFLMRTHKWPNLKNPQTFNEKTTWLKLNRYNNDDLVSKCADKYAVRKYVELKGSGEVLNELYGVYDEFDEIDFDKLPDQFVLKCVHGCAYNIIVKDKSDFDIDEARKKVRSWQREKYGYATAELHYIKIKPRIIVEKYLCDKNGKMPEDYKFYCMNGKSVGCMVCSNRVQGTHDFCINFFDNDWEELPYFKKELRGTEKIEKPKNWKKMIEYAEKLSEGFPFVRVDFYNDNGKVIFGEMTFTPACCCNPKHSEEGNRELGKKLEIGI